MALDIRSFFIGIATVVGLLAVGFGSGIMMGGVLSGDQKAPTKIERQAGKEPTGSIVKSMQPAARDAQPQPKDPGALARDLDAIKPISQPTVVTPAAKSEPAPQQTQPAPGPAPQPVSTQPTPLAAPPPAPPAPTAIAEAPAPGPAPEPPAQATQQAAVPPVGAQKPVSLVQPADQQFSLSRREEARLRAQQRREERAQRREERRNLLAQWRQQEQLRREQMKASDRVKPEAADDDDDDAPVLRPMVRPRGLFDGLFRRY
jgi:hypothetical protein